MKRAIHNIIFFIFSCSVCLSVDSQKTTKLQKSIKKGGLL